MSQPIVFLALASQKFSVHEICPGLSSEKKAICQAVRTWNVDRIKDGLAVNGEFIKILMV